MYTPMGALTHTYTCTYNRPRAHPQDIYAQHDLGAERKALAAEQRTTADLRERIDAMRSAHATQIAELKAALAQGALTRARTVLSIQPSLRPLWQHTCTRACVQCDGAGAAHGP